VINERRSLSGAKVRNRRKRSDESGGGIGERHVAAREHKGTNARQLQCQALQPPITDALVTRQDDPPVSAGERQPDASVGTFRKMMGEALDLYAGRGKT
jgi:hypothetical protein